MPKRQSEPDLAGFSIHVKEPLQELFALDADYALPRHFWITYTLEGDERLRLDVAVDDRGSAHCTRIEVLASDESGITTETLRGVPVARLLRLGTTAALMKYERSADGDVIGFARTDNEEKRQFYQRYSQARRPKQGSAITDEQLEQVATVYRRAVEDGKRPTEIVGETMNVARSTAARWITRARERGFLGPALRGRAGEADDAG
jgi:hypothetical protein